MKESLSTKEQNEQKKEDLTLKDDKRSERLIYLGPNLPGGKLSKYAIYKGGLPTHLNDVYEACPAIKKLFVEPSIMAKKEQAINQKGTPESVFFSQVLDYSKKGGGQ